MSDEQIGYGQTVAIPSFEAEQAVIGEQGYLTATCQNIIVQLVYVRRSAGAPSGKYHITINFVVDKE